MFLYHGMSDPCECKNDFSVLIDFLLTLKAATLIFISGRGLSISFAKEGKLGPMAKR